mgnify:CR=1 FL=1
MDPQGHILDPQKSSIDWNWEVQMRDGAAPPKPPLTQEDVQRLGNVTDTVLLKARYQLDQPAELVLSPERFIARKSKRVSTTSPAYMNWRTSAYLAKVERSLSEIASEREIPLNPSYCVKLTWWLNGGAVGGHGGTTMPLSGMTGDFNWFKHPWAISHELLHGFGYGHDEDMNRTDRVIQKRFLEHKWFVADHPNHVPEFLLQPNADLTEFVPGKPVDLLNLIDLERDTLSGEWKLKNGVLFTPTSSGGRLKLPVEAPASYELLMVVTRLKGRDTQAKRITAPCWRSMAGWDGRAVCIFSMVVVAIRMIALTRGASFPIRKSIPSSAASLQRAWKSTSTTTGSSTGTGIPNDSGILLIRQRPEDENCSLLKQRMYRTGSPKFSCERSNHQSESRVSLNQPENLKRSQDQHDRWRVPAMHIMIKAMHQFTLILFYFEMKDSLRCLKRFLNTLNIR